MQPANRRTVAFDVRVTQSCILLKTKDRWIDSNQEIPFTAIGSLVWGYANLLFIDWREKDSFKRSSIYGKHSDLEALASLVKAESPWIKEDLAGKSIGEAAYTARAMLVLLVMLLPVLIFFLAIYFGRVSLPY